MSDLPETDTGAAFAAGIATATAAQAQEDASAAEFRADLAQEAANIAAAEAAEAAGAADAARWAAQSDMDDLRAHVDARLDEIRELVTSPPTTQADGGKPEPAHGTMPEPERKEAPSSPPPGAGDDADEGKPKHAGYGSKTWFKH